MDRSEDEIIEKYGKGCGHCNRDTLLPYAFEFTGISCRFNLIKRKHELSETQRKRINFINRLKYAERKLFCVCKDVNKIYGRDGYDKIYEILSTLKNKKSKNKQYPNRNI